MSSSKRVSREDIIHAAFEIVKEKGIGGVNARDVAKRLNTSVQPIFYRFNNMEDLKIELLKYSLDYYREYILNIKGEGPEYKEIGINYIRFASREPNLFKFIFMGNYHIKVEDFAFFDKSYVEVEKVACDYDEISDDVVKRFHLKMWMFTHGIASLIATGTCEFSDEEISALLTEEFEALMKDIIYKKEGDKC